MTILDKSYHNDILTIKMGRGSEDKMLRKKPSVLHVVMFGISVGIAVVVIGYFVISLQHKRSLEASRKGLFPKMPEIGDVRQYASDSEGDYYYAENRTAQKTSPENKMIWSRLVYSEKGRNSYIYVRKQNGLFTEGLESLHQRTILYEFSCDKDKAGYAVVEVFEVGNDGKTLDYGKTGKDREWGRSAPGSPMEKLAGLVCPKT
ncbi:MAG: hypothetical protein KBB65_03060 [Syntrophorhabdaceae bacterium]|nr:hypothetical protein [Syntrophorhabdaceae bacterium]